MDEFKYDPLADEALLPPPAQSPAPPPVTDAFGLGVPGDGAFPSFQQEPSELAAEVAAAAAVGAAMDAAGELMSGVQPATFGALEASGLSAAGTGQGQQNLDLLLDVQIPVSVEIGRTQMSLDAILDLVPGSIVPLEKKAEEPVDLRVNGKLVARGEVVLVDDVYGIRITEIVGDGVSV